MNKLEPGTGRSTSFPLVGEIPPGAAQKRLAEHHAGRGGCRSPLVALSCGGHRKGWGWTRGGKVIMVINVWQRTAGKDYISV